MSVNHSNMVLFAPWSQSAPCKICCQHCWVCCWWCWAHVQWNSGQPWEHPDLHSPLGLTPLYTTRHHVERQEQNREDKCVFESVCFKYWGWCMCVSDHWCYRWRICRRSWPCLSPLWEALSSESVALDIHHPDPSLTGAVQDECVKHQFFLFCHVCIISHCISISIICCIVWYFTNTYDKYIPRLWHLTSFLLRVPVWACPALPARLQTFYPGPGLPYHCPLPLPPPWRPPPPPHLTTGAS